MAAAATDNPEGYYVGAPVENRGEQKAPAPPAKKAVDEQVNAPEQDVPGYYRRRVGRGKTDASDQNEEPGFLAKCLVCFSGGGNAR